MVDLKSTVKAMCKAFPGGRSAMAGALGISETKFDNKLYQKNGCRFFELDELEAMEDLSDTNLLTDYFAKRRGCLLIDRPKFEELDHVEMYSRSVRTAAARGHVDQIIALALEDGFIDESEAEEIEIYHRRHMVAREEEVQALTSLLSRKKAGKGDAPSVQLGASGALTNQCGAINA